MEPPPAFAPAGPAPQTEAGPRTRGGYAASLLATSRKKRSCDSGGNGDVGSDGMRLVVGERKRGHGAPLRRRGGARVALASLLATRVWQTPGPQLRWPDEKEITRARLAVHTHPPQRASISSSGTTVARGSIGQRCVDLTECGW